MPTGRTTYAGAAALVALAALAVLARQFVYPGVYCCVNEDTAYYLNWTRQFADALSAGTFYPRWMPDSHGGYGNPDFVFYSPLVVYLTALLKLATGDISLSVALVKLIGLVLSGLFMFVFVSGTRGAKAGLVSAVLYLLLPFRVFDQYIIGVFPSKFALAWFPLILHFARRAATEKRAGRGTAGLAVSYAMLCLTHLLSAYMFSLVIAAYCAAVSGKGRITRGLSRAILGGLAGLGLAAFFLLPVALLGGQVHLGSFGMKGWGRYWNNYLFYIGSPQSPYTLPFYGYMAKSILWTVAAGAGVYLLGRSSREEDAGRETLFFVGASLVCLFLMTSLSWPVWKFVPGMSMVIFPTRWASLMVFCTACFAGMGFAGGPAARGHAVRYMTLMIAAIAAVTIVISVMYDAEIISKGCRYTRADIASLQQDMDVEEYVPKAVSLDWLRQSAAGKPGPKVFRLNGEIPVKIGIMRWDAQERIFTSESEVANTLVVRTFYFPGWRAYVDGMPVKTGVQPVTGAMLLDIPAGRHKILLCFGSTNADYAGWALSAIAVAFTILLIGRRDAA